MGLQRRVKLGFIARKSLLRKGKKDAKKKVVQNNKFPISPFFDEEIAVCIANLHKEYEKYLKYKTKLTNKISKYDKKSNQFTAHIRMLDNESTYQKSILENLNKIVFDEVDVKNSESKRLIGESVVLNKNELISDEILKEFRAIEKRAVVEAEKHKVNTKKEFIEEKIEKYPQKTFKIEKKKVHLEVLSKRELKKLCYRFDYFISRCNQHYELTAARISAYWNGVKYNFNENEETNFDVSTILSRVEYTINVYKQLGDDIQC